MAIRQLKLLGTSEAADAPFRSLPEVDSYLLNVVKEKLDELDGLFRQLQRQFSANESATAAEIEFVVNKDDGKKGKGKGQKISIERIDKLIAPKVGDLRKNFAIVDELSEQVETLDAMYNSVQVKFRGTRGLDVTLRSIKAMQKSAEAKLERALSFLNSIGEKYAPQPFRDLIEATIGQISPLLNFKSHKTYQYAWETKDGNLAFSIYIELRGLIDEDGEQYPQFFMVFTCVLNINEDHKAMVPTYYVTVMPNFVTPGKFLLGKVVKDPDDATSKLGALLELENINTAIGVQPHRLTEHDLQKSKFKMGSFVAEIGADPGTIYFEFLKSVNSREKAAEIAQSLYVDLKGLLQVSMKGVKLSARLGQSSDKRWMVKFSIKTLAKNDQLSVKDIEFLKEHFDLDDAKIRQIVKVVNG